MHWGTNIPVIAIFLTETFDIIAPEVTSFTNPGFIVFLSYQTINPVRLTALILLGFLTLYALIASIRSQIIKKPEYWVMAVYALFNFAFYPPYSFGHHEYFMFSAHYTFPLFYLLALPFGTIKSETSIIRYSKIALLGALITFVMLNNWNFILASIGRPVSE